MKKIIIAIVLLLSLLFSQTGCNYQNKNTEERLAFLLQEMHDYNANDPDKNLLLQFLHDEIPIINYGEESRTVYFKDISEVGNVDDKRYYIVDMDGDRKQDFCIQYPASIDIIKYNEEKKCFELWLTETNKQFPIGNKQMYYALYTTTTVYAYLLYDEFANLIKSEAYSVAEYYDKEKNTTYMTYEIDFKLVSERKWYEETGYLFGLIENAPKPLSYQELLADTE